MGDDLLDMIKKELNKTVDVSMYNGEKSKDDDCGCGDVKSNVDTVNAVKVDNDWISRVETHTNAEITLINVQDCVITFINSNDLNKIVNKGAKRNTKSQGVWFSCNGSSGGILNEDNSKSRSISGDVKIKSINGSSFMLEFDTLKSNNSITAKEKVTPFN